MSTALDALTPSRGSTDGGAAPPKLQRGIVRRVESTGRVSFIIPAYDGGRTFYEGNHLGAEVVEGEPVLVAYAGGQWHVLGAHPASDAMAMQWRGYWEPGTVYRPGDVVHDDGWTMVATAETSSRPAPQPNGGAYWLNDGFAPSTVEPTTKRIFTGQRYTWPEGVPGWITGYRFWPLDGAPTDHYQVVFRQGDRLNIQPELSGLAALDQWVEVAVEPVIANGGETFDVLLAARNTAGSSTFVGDWDYQTPGSGQPSAPGAGEIQHHNKGTDSLRVSHTDDASADRSAELATVNPGDTISANGATWIVMAVQDQGDWSEFTVTPESQASPDGVATFAFEVTGAQPVGYAVESGAHSNPNATGLYGEPTLEDVGEDAANQFGVDIQVQPAYVSPDWQLVAYSGGSSGGSAGGSTFPLAREVVLYKPTSDNKTLPQTPAVLDTTNMRATVELSGERDVRVSVTATTSGGVNESIEIYLVMDGDSADLWPWGRSGYRHATGTGTGIVEADTATWEIPREDISAGVHTFDVWGSSSAGTGILYASGGSNSVTIVVEEIPDSEGAQGATGPTGPAYTEPEIGSAAADGVWGDLAAYATEGQTVLFWWATDGANAANSRRPYRFTYLGGYWWPTNPFEWIGARATVIGQGVPAGGSGVWSTVGGTDLRIPPTTGNWWITAACHALYATGAGFGWLRTGVNAGGTNHACGVQNRNPAVGNGAGGRGPYFLVSGMPAANPHVVVNGNVAGTCDIGDAHVVAVPIRLDP